MPLTIPSLIEIKTAAGATAAFLSPEADGLKDVFIDNELNGSCTLTFSLPTTSNKKQYLTEAYRIYAPDSTGVMKEFVILTPDSIDRTRDGKEVWDKITAQESWVKLGKDYVDPGISNDPQTPSPPELAVIILSGGSDLSGGLYTVGSAAHALYAILQGTGWSVGTADQTGTHDLETEKISVLANIQKIQEIWGGYLVWDSVNKTVSLRDETSWAPYSGYQIRYAKNLKGITRTSDFDIITKLYPFGEDDLNIGSVNGGVIYLSNNTYTAEILEGIYTNQDKTTAQELKDDATKYLSKVCRPRHNYRIDQVDLRTLSGYTHESFDVGHMVDIIDADLDANDQARVIRHRRNVFQPWICELEVGDPLDTDAKLMADSQITVKYLNSIKTSKGQITAYKLVDESLIASKIAAAAVDASKLNTKTVILFEDTWTDNSPAAGSVAWNQHKLYYAGVEHIILAGNTAQKYIYWDGVANTYSTSASMPTLTDGQFVVAMNNGGLHDTVWDKGYAREFIGSVLIAQAAILSAHIGNAQILDAHIANMSANKITTGQLLAYLVEIMGKNGYFRINGDELISYDKSGVIMARFAHYETLGTLLAAFTRASTAYDDFGNLIASGVPRYPYMALPGPVWQDDFSTDQLAAEYTSGGDVAGTPTVSGGVLTYTGGTQATLTKKDLLLQDCDIVINSDQVQAGGIIARYQDNNNYYALVLRDDTSSPTANLDLYKYVNRSWTQLGVADVTWARGTSKPIKFSLRGSRLEAWFDGVKVIEKTDTTFTGGAVGLRNNNATAFRVLDFTVYYAQKGAQVEQGATNVLLYSQQLDNAAWTQSNIAISANSTLAPDGATTADTLTDSNATAVGYIIQSKAIANDSTSWTVSIYIKKDTDETRFPALCLFLTGGTTIVQIAAQINTKTGATAARLSVGTVVINPVEQIGDYWKLSVTATNNSTGNISADTYVIPVDGTVFGTQSAAATGSAIFWQADLVNLPYPTTPVVTTSASATRNTEVLTVPTAGVFTKSNWTVKFKFTPTSNMVASGVWKGLFNCTIDANNKYELDVDPTGKLYVVIGSGGTWYTISDPTVLAVGQSYEIALSGNGSVMRLCKNGAQVGADTAYVEPVGTLPANMYVGSNSGGTSQANGIFSDFAVLNIAETLADHQADYATGLPLIYDDVTTYLMSCDGTLQPTVRGFGLWSKNGRIILQDPATGQGIEVWDGATRKILFGRQDDGTVGGELIGCKLYANEIYSGAKGATTYAKLTPGSEAMEVWYNAKRALVMSTYGSMGTVNFWNTVANDLRGQIYAFDDIDGDGLKIHAKTGAGVGKMLLLEANYIYTKAPTHFFDGDLHVTGNITKGGTVSYVEPTLNYGTRLLYIVETPELKYYDSGVIHLLSGEALVKFDPIFLECIEPDTDLTPWQIWVECYGENGVYVSETGETYFKVKERNGGMSDNKVVWRFEATRKNYAGIRLMEVVK